MEIEITLPSPAALRAALTSIVSSWDDFILHFSPAGSFRDPESIEVQCFNLLDIQLTRGDVQQVAHRLGASQRTANRWIKRWLRRGLIDDTSDKNKFYKLCCLDDYYGLYSLLYFRRDIHLRVSSEAHSRDDGPLTTKA